jgi:hypothetical protein
MEDYSVEDMDMEGKLDICNAIHRVSYAAVDVGDVGKLRSVPVQF